MVSATPGIVLSREREQLRGVRRGLAERFCFVFKMEEQQHVFLLMERIQLPERLVI